MAQYLNIHGELDDLKELSIALSEASVENHLGEVMRFSPSAPDIVTLLIDTVPYASVASVLITWIKRKQNRKAHIHYIDGTSITL